MRPVTAKRRLPPKKSDATPRASFASKNRRIMSKEAPISLAEHDFILESLKEDVRLDGRQADQLRPLNISFGEEYGHVKLQLGKTSIVVRISAEVTKPQDERPFDGLFNIVLELSAMGSPAWENGRSNDLESYVTQIIDRVVRHSNALDTESLCILKGVSCWSIRADVHVLDYDGNLTDAACIAIMSGLQHFRRPDAVVRDGQVIVYGVEERVPVALNITHKPLSITFNVFNEGKSIILDATRKEEQASEGELVIGINNAGDVCFLSKFSGAPMDALEVVNKSNLALTRVKEINTLVDKVLQADLARRATKGMAELSRAENDR
ncbi:Exoribonuclease phosphorolytic domain 1 [Penicillium capsulatum]|uniref:Exosome complex component RRP45 n=1 Tax=Penicillium capsulatum TaxID=69766 RepID=A0A9W9LQS6_9EURO|nr:Exoribonuclease phosphorolytic domain 1 [Penicillium capsulatum]KAJ6136407.1 Exoribonuclease phosphorolytic domain 1 [Penicillium capsulatum]